MKSPIIYPVIFIILLLSCNGDDANCEPLNVQLNKKIEISYTQYGNTKTVTYYENNKPILDSIFYFDDNYPEHFQSKREWLYNSSGLVRRTVLTFPQSDESYFTAIEYDDINRISYINRNDTDEYLYTYNGLEITKTLHNIQGNANYNYLFELDINHHIISETNYNGIQTNTAMFEDNDIVKFNNLQNSNLQFSYLATYTIPDFMKHIEFGEYVNNYLLFKDSFNSTTIINTGERFVNEIIYNSSELPETIAYYYEFNQESLPLYIRLGDINIYGYSETFFEYE